MFGKEASTTGSTVQTSTNQFSISVTERFEKFIEVPLHKKIRHNLVLLFNYFDNFAPKWHTLHTIISVIRMLQFLGPALMAGCKKFWGDGTVEAQAISIISVLFHIVPVQYRTDADTISIVFVVYSVLFFSYMIAAAFHLKKTSRLTKFTTYFLNFNLSTLGFILPPFAIENVAELCSDFVAGRQITPTNITFLILSIICLGFYIWITTVIYGNTLFFRQTSLQSVQSLTQITIVAATFIVTAISGFQYNLPHPYHIIFAFLMIPVYIYTLQFCITNVNFILTFISEINMAFSISGIAIVAYEGACLALNKRIGDIALLIDLAIIVISFIIGHFVIKKQETGHLLILDEYEEAPDQVEIKRVRQWITILCTGYKFAHSACLDYSIMRYATDLWPTNISVWEVYAKFAAIYPENTRMLLAISQSIQSMKLKGEGIESVISEIGTIVKLRESNYSPDLKSRLTKISRVVFKAKSRLRNIWDDILQGNVKDMNENVEQAYAAVELAQAEYDYILMQYPNNRFVARSYSLFLREVKGDYLLAAKWKDNIRLLQKGIQIAQDTVHELGIATFPNLPYQVTEQQSQNNLTMTEFDTAEEITMEDDTTKDGNATLNKLISEHKVQGVSKMITGLTTLLVIIFIAPIVLMILAKGYMNDLMVPLSGIYGTAYCRTLNCLVPVFGYSYCLVRTPEDETDPNSLGMFDDTHTRNLSLPAFGGGQNSKEILNYLCKAIIESTVMLTEIRTYKLGDEHMDKVRSYLFDERCAFYYMQNLTKNETSIMSADIVTVRLANQMTQVLEREKFTKNDLAQPEILTVIYNYLTPSRLMDESLLEMSDFIVQYNKDNIAIYKIIMIALTIFNVLLYSISYPFIVRTLDSNREEVNKSLTHLSKTVISQVSSSLTSIKNKSSENSTTTTDDNGNENNKQEENIIKLFTSCTDSNGHSTGLILVQTACIILIIACACGAIIFVCMSYIAMSETMARNAPHIDYLLSISASVIRVFGSLFKIISERNLIPGVCDSFEKQLAEIKQQIDIVDRSFACVRFGNFSKGLFPLVTIRDGIEDVKKYIYCEDAINAPTNFYAGISCFEAGSQQYLINAIIEQYIVKLEKLPKIYPNGTINRYPNPRADKVQDMWQHGAVMLYGAFYYEVTSKVIENIRTEILSSFTPMIYVTIILMVASVAITSILIILSMNQKKFIIFTLKLFLLCPSEAVISSTKIMKLLKGAYGDVSEDFTSKHVAFYGEVVNKLQDFIIVADKDTDQVTLVNDSFKKIFGEAPETLSGFIDSDMFEGDKSNLNNVPGILTYKNNNGDTITVQLTIIVAGTCRIVDGRDLSEDVKHDKLIEFEKKKSDSMLSSILPASLVPRVQAGETNISFSVQSVSVCFIDIVEFTPWCGSHAADYVMKTLNTIFKRFDAIVGTLPTLTKIKCIGDCYMNAGGIFDEVNQPAVHAKEMVEFGCQAIKTIEALDEEINEKLRIRCGINTGGPIVAGVIGLAKPTFEILGPPINIAQQMEHHGVPMMVHISRSVYELIYGGSFNVKERGEIEIKKGKVSTYLVTPQ